MRQYIEWLYSLPGVTRVYSPFAGRPESFAQAHMGSFGPEVWITCHQCGWGAWGGKDHVHIDGVELILLCQWCFEVPDPPFWTTRPRTSHFLSNMKVLPNILTQDGHIPDLISEYLFQIYEDVHYVDNDVSEDAQYVQDIIDADDE